MFFCFVNYVTASLMGPVKVHGNGLFCIEQQYSLSQQVALDGQNL
jgi:hypothetical protein